MQFNHGKIKFEVSHLDHVVITTIRRLIQPAQGGKPARVTKEYTNVDDLGTRVWYRLKFAKGIRWAKFRHHGTIPDESDLISADAEQWETPQGIQMMIMDAMQRPDIDLWFSGSYCNIRIIQNWQDIQRIRAQEEARQQHRNFRKVRSVRQMVTEAVQQSGAQLREESISTPFGLVPVLTIRGSGRRKKA